MKIYLVWAWFDNDEPMVIRVVSSREKAKRVIEKARTTDEYEGYEFSIDERTLDEDIG